MRFAALLAAAAALWMQPAGAVTIAETIGADTQYDLTMFSGEQRWDFRVIGDLPENVAITIPTFDQAFKTTKTWTDGGVFTDLVSLNVPIGEMTSHILTITPTTWSILYDWDNAATFDRCATSAPVIGQVCGQSFTLWANSAWFPFKSIGPYDDLPFATFELTITPVPEPSTWVLMILGVGLTGLVMRRRHAAYADLSFQLPSGNSAPS